MELSYRIAYTQPDRNTRHAQEHSGQATLPEERYMVAAQRMWRLSPATQTTTTTNTKRQRQRCPCSSAHWTENWRYRPSVSWTDVQRKVDRSSLARGDGCGDDRRICDQRPARGTTRDRRVRHYRLCGGSTSR